MQILKLGYLFSILIRAADHMIRPIGILDQGTCMDKLMLSNLATVF